MNSDDHNYGGKTREQEAQDSTFILGCLVLVLIVIAVAVIAVAVVLR